MGELEGRRLVGAPRNRLETLRKASSSQLNQRVVVNKRHGNTRDEVKTFANVGFIRKCDATIQNLIKHILVGYSKERRLRSQNQEKDRTVAYGESISNLSVKHVIKDDTE